MVEYVNNPYEGTPDQDELKDFSGGDEFYIGFASGDLIVGGGGNDLIIGGAGDDRLIGGKGNDIIKGGFGDDYLAGGHGNDLLLGLQGNNVLNGGQDDDILVSGSGSNKLVGGSGSDKFVFTDKFDGHGEAKVLDFVIGEDTAYFVSSSVNSLDDLTVSYDAAGNLMLSDGADLSIKFIGITEADFVAHAGDMFQF